MLGSVSRRRGRHRAPSRTTATALVWALFGGLLTAIAVVAPAQSAQAATVSLGTITAQQADHRGKNSGTGGSNCIRYSPPGTSTSSTFVASPNQAITAHGSSGNCPSTLSTTSQSAVGFSPSAVTSISDGTQFLLGRMVHYNNPINASDEYYSGNLNVALGGFTSPNTLTFPWTLDETPNDYSPPSDPRNNDEIAFSSQISATTLTQGGQTYRLVVTGFVPVANGTTCPSTPAGTPVNDFSTVEQTQTHACLYASIVQPRSLTIVKQVAGTSPPARSFNYTSTSSLAGSPWDTTSFSLAAGGNKNAELTSGQTVSVTEADPKDDRWALSDLTCTEKNAAGATVAARGFSANLSSRSLTLSSVPAPLNGQDPGITCTYTNSYTPRATLTLVKQVQGNAAAANLWTLTATGTTDSAAAGTRVSGPSGDASVTKQRVVSGKYVLSEVGTGAASTGFVQVGNWSCVQGSTTFPVAADGTVTLPDLPSASGITCTVTNRRAVGTLLITKAVDAPAGAFTGGSAQTFSGTYDCGTGYTGSFTTLTTASGVSVNNLPVGRQCTVTETGPTGGLRNASYSWTSPTFTSQPVTIADQQTSTVTITNHAVQSFGNLSVTKTVSGPGGYTGGAGRVFPVSYACTLAGGPASSGTLSVTVGAAATSADIPTGSVCSITESLTAQAGDFADPSYVWVNPPAISPSTVTVGANTTSAVTVTNTYTRQLGSLVIAKVVQGGGYGGGSAPNFTVRYDCGAPFAGEVTVGDGATVAVPNLPAQAACAVQEVSPAEGLLAPGYDWGGPTWSPGPVATVPANGSVTLTVTNPTVAVFGKVSVTKAVTGETQGVRTGASFRVTVSCDNGQTFPFDLGAGAAATTPDVPVGTSCTVSETAPTAVSLVDSSFAWGATPPAQTVQVISSGQVLPVTVTNTVTRVRGHLTITKAPITPAGVVDPARSYTMTYSCRYGNDAPVTGSVTVTAGSSAPTSDVLLNSVCSVTESPSSVTDPPSTDPSWVWLPATVAPAQPVVVTSADTPLEVTVTNRIQQVTGSFVLTKSVVGAGKDQGYPAGGTFHFTVSCPGVLATTADLADGQSYAPTTAIPVGRTCTITEAAGRPVTPPAFGWDPVAFTVNGQPAAGGSASFTIPVGGDPVRIVATNPITPRLSSVRVTKAVTGETPGLKAGVTFPVTLNCGAGGTYNVSVPAGGEATQSGLPVGASCVVTETLPTDGLVDASYAWGPATFAPGDATATVTLGSTVSVGITNTIVRVTAPVRLAKTFAGAQGVVDPARTYPVDWSCSYGGSTVASGSTAIAADPVGVVVAPSVPVTSTCTATEGALGAPSVDPAFRWETPVVTGIPAPGVTQAGANTITVANTLVRDSGTVEVHKQVTGATEGYVNLGTGATDFTLHGQCFIPGHPEIATRFADGVIGDGGTVPIVASIGWTCRGREDTPSQSLLKDTSYAWGPAVLTPAGEFSLTRANPTQVFTAVNPIIRVRSSLTITKQVTDPSGVVDRSTQFTGGYSCQYGTDTPVTGRWTITPGATGSTYTVDDLLLNSVCTVTEDDPGRAGLPDGSWSWSTPVVGAPVTIAAGGSSGVTVTNTVERQFAGLQVTKTLTDPDQGVSPGSTFSGVWTCVQGSAPNLETHSARFSVPAGTTVLFTPDDRLVPATSLCSVKEDTPDPSLLRDASFGWDQPVYDDPAEVTLTAGTVETRTIANSVHRVYSDVPVQKLVTGPGAGLVDPARAYTGTVSCQYREDTPVVKPWSATTGTPALVSGVLVGSMCAVTENAPGAGGQPVTGDRSYVWLAPVTSDPVVVTPPATATPALVVTNPTDRLFGTFTVGKTVQGATEGLVDPKTPYRMTYVCTPGTGAVISGTLDVVVDQVRTVGPEQEIPVDTPCTLTEPIDGMPPLLDSAWTWGQPAFTVDGTPAQPTDRTIAFTIPQQQEDVPQPTVAVQVTNTVQKAPGAFTVTKSSDPATGTQVPVGSAITYTLTVDSTGTVPVHGVRLTDSLSGVLTHATLVDGSITAPAGTTATLDPATSVLTWDVGTVPNGEQRVLTYQVKVGAAAYDATLTNLVSGAGDVPPSTCGTAPVAPIAPGRTVAGTSALTAAAPCGTTHTTPSEPAPPTPGPTPGPGPAPTPGPTPGPAPAPGPSPMPYPTPTPLPDTGSNPGPLVGGAALLLLLGAAAVYWSRRRSMR